MPGLSSRISAAVLSVAMVGAAPALALDGEVLISASSVNNPGGIGGGNNDAPGYPVTIDKAGNYKLTGNLTATDKTAFIITGNDVTINLNGFSIIGFESGGGLTSAGRRAGSSHGISAAAALRLSVRNGTIRDFTGNAIDSRNGSAAVVENMRILSNDGFGVWLGSNSQFIGNTIFDSGLGGAILGNTSIASGNAINANTRLGGSYNLECGGQCLVEGNVVANAATGGGVGTGAGSLVNGNTISGNAGLGLSGLTGGTNKQAGFTNNVIVNNAGGTVQGILAANPNLCRPNSQFCN